MGSPPTINRVGVASILYSCTRAKCYWGGKPNGGTGIGQIPDSPRSSSANLSSSKVYINSVISRHESAKMVEIGRFIVISLREQGLSAHGWVGLGQFFRGTRRKTRAQKRNKKAEAPNRSEGRSATIKPRRRRAEINDFKFLK